MTRITPLPPPLPVAPSVPLVSLRQVELTERGPLEVLSSTALQSSRVRPHSLECHPPPMQSPVSASAGQCRLCLRCMREPAILQRSSASTRYSPRTHCSFAAWDEL